MSLFLRILKTGGRVASIVPDGVLFGSSNAHKSIRKEIVENNKLSKYIPEKLPVFTGKFKIIPNLHQIHSSIPPYKCK